MGLDSSCDSLHDEAVLKAGRRHHHKSPRDKFTAPQIACGHELVGRGDDDVWGSIDRGHEQIIRRPATVTKQGRVCKHYTHVSHWARGVVGAAATLAGRISYLELTHFQLVELPQPQQALPQHWERGGYPDSYLAPDAAASLQWRRDFVTSYVERYLPQQGVLVPPVVLRRLRSMLAHQQGATLNLSRLAGSLGLDGKTVRRYLDLLEGLFLIRSLPAWSRNAGKRLVKAAKVYWRDSGILHSLAGLADLKALFGHLLCGASWEGYCIEQIIRRFGPECQVSHYRSHAGAEVDPVVETPTGEVTAIEIKRTLSPKLTPGLRESMATIRADRGVMVIPEGAAFPLSEQVTAIGLLEFLESLR